MAISAAVERLRSLVFPDAPELIMRPSWMRAYEDMLSRYNRYQYYYSGQVFNELADPKRPEDSERKYPLRINLCREWVDMLSGYLYGQWTDQVASFEVEREEQQSGNIADSEERRCAEMESFLRRQWNRNDNDSMADIAANSMMVYGGAVIKTYWSNVERRIIDEWLSPDVFIARWHPTDLNTLLEAVVAYTISKIDAKDIFKISGARYSSLPGDVMVVERWTATTFRLYVEDIEVYNRKNEMGFIPYTYIPKVRSRAANYGYYGVSALEDTMALQDEVNERAADIGDGVAYSSHPIRVVTNYTGKDDLEIGADAMWNLGFGFGGREPKAYTLDAKTNYGEALEYVRSVEHMGRTAAHLPSIAFGEDEGSQRSGTTLLIRFLPLTQEIRRARLHMAAGLKRKAYNTLRLAVANSGFTGASFGEGDLDRLVNVRFAPILPRDVKDKVDEWSIRIAGGFGTPQEAYTDLGHPDPDRAAEEALLYQERTARNERGGSSERPDDNKRRAQGRTSAQAGAGQGNQKGKDSVKDG